MTQKDMPVKTKQCASICGSLIFVVLGQRDTKRHACGKLPVPIQWASSCGSLIFLILLGLLEPLDEGLDIPQKHVAPLLVAALLIPPLDGILSQDVVIVQNAYDVGKQLQELRIFVAVHLGSELQCKRQRSVQVLPKPV
jgi:hypothetical protein